VRANRSFDADTERHCAAGRAGETLNEFIAELQQLRAAHGGDLQVGCLTGAQLDLEHMSVTWSPRTCVPRRKRLSTLSRLSLTFWKEHT
jgi:hypothetical protein